MTSKWEKIRQESFDEYLALWNYDDITEWAIENDYTVKNGVWLDSAGNAVDIRDELDDAIEHYYTKSEPD